MKHLSIFLALLFFISLSPKAQVKAVTSNGDEVLLNTDGTWKYAEANTHEDDPGKKVDTSKMKFTKNADASFLAKSSKINVGVYLNPKKWSFEKSKETDASELEFALKGKDAYAMLITEKIELPMSSLRAAALSNGREVSPDINIVKEEYRNVNGKLVLLMQMNGTINGIKFSYLGYYASSEKGTVQLMTYTATNLIDEYGHDLYEFLNGFVEYD